MKHLLLILALFVVGCSDSSTSIQPKDFGIVKVSGVCADSENTYEGNFIIDFLGTKNSEILKVFTLDTSTPDFVNDDYLDNLVERVSNWGNHETIDIVMKYESPKVVIHEMTQEIYEKNIWNIKSIHGYGLNEDSEGNFGYDFYVKGSCQLKVIERNSIDGSFLKNKKIIFDHF